MQLIVNFITTCINAKDLLQSFFGGLPNVDKVDPWGQPTSNGFEII